MTVRRNRRKGKKRPESLRTGFIFTDGITTSTEDIKRPPLVRIFASYDIGWSKRGTDRRCNNLNGVGTLYGPQSKKIHDLQPHGKKILTKKARELHMLTEHAQTVL